MPEFINILIKSNTFNFLIVVGLIVFGVIKLDINGKIRNIAEEIKAYVNSSENEKIEAQQKLDTINSRVQKLPEVIERIKHITETSVKNYENKMQRDIAEEKNDISRNADRLFELEVKKFKNKLTALLSEKSIEIARENALKQLNDNKELHNHYIECAINELDRINL